MRGWAWWSMASSCERRGGVAVCLWTGAGLRLRALSTPIRDGLRRPWRALWGRLGVERQGGDALIGLAHLIQWTEAQRAF
jgi:hypothetical protein